MSEHDLSRPFLDQNNKVWMIRRADTNEALDAYVTLPPDRGRSTVLNLIGHSCKQRDWRYGVNAGIALAYSSSRLGRLLHLTSFEVPLWIQWTCIVSGFILSAICFRAATKPVF